jgi:Kef-type K+ transport system membrane component KefB
MLVGIYVSPRLFKIASKLRGSGLLLATALIICFGLAYFAAIIGLAPIVGAFAAGLALEEVHYKDFLDRGEHRIEEAIEPLTSFLVPIFFVLMGIKVDLSTMARFDILGFAVALTVVAVIGKQACALGVLERGANRTAVGLGMIPRGEVGLIFAGIGASLYLAGERVIAPPVYSAVVFMVIVTTLVTPPLLSWSLARGDRARPGHEGAGSATKPG